MKIPSRIYFFVFIFSLTALPGYSQTITSVVKLASPTLPNAGLIVNGGFETGAPPVNTWYQWAKSSCNPTPATRNPPSWTVTSHTSNSSGGSPVRYATWGRLVTGSGSGNTPPYPYIATNQSGLYEVYSTSSTACTNTNTTAISSDPGTFPLGVASLDGNNYLYFGNGTGTITGFPTPMAAWISSTNSPNNLRVYADNSSLGTLTGPAPVTLAQTITTVSGSAYILEFWVSGEELSVNNQRDGFFQLQIGTQILYLAIPGSKNDHGLGKQFYYQVNFNAGSTSTLIKFVNYCHPVGPSPVSAGWSPYLGIGGTGSELILDDVRMNLASSLPVHLVSFTGNKNGTKINLSWKVSDEINFSHYEVERSFNSADIFNMIGHVDISRNGTGIYNFTDELSNYLQKDYAFYRLKMIDRNGSFSYSNVVKMKLNSNAAVIIYPTIIKRGEMISVENTNRSGPAVIIVTNINGQLLKKIPFNGTNILKIQTDGWAAGTYYISMIDPQTKNNFKIIIHD